MCFRVSLGFGKQGIRNFHGCLHAPILPYFEIWVYGATSARQVNRCAVCPPSASSAVSRTSFSTCACASNIRSKGSRWCHGSNATCRVAKVREKLGPKGRTIPNPLFLPTSFHHERRLWLRAPWFRNSEGFRNIVRQSVEIWSDPDFTRHRAGLPGPAWTSGFGNVVHRHV